MNWVIQAGRMTLRDWRAGELRLILVALIVAVAAVTSVGFLADRLQLALERDGAQLLGGDLVLSTQTLADPAIREAAAQRGLQMTDTVIFPSMAVAGGPEAQQAQLVSVKAVGAGYPLRGVVSLRYVEAQPAGATGEAAPDASLPGAGSSIASSSAAGVGIPAQDIPAPGTVWLEPSLLPLLGVKVGDAIELGESRFVVSNVIAFEPDRGMNFVNLAPRLLMRHDELAATRLVTEGSRISYRLLFAGEPSSIANFTDWLQRNPQQGQRIETLASGRPEMRRTLDRAQSFLSLVAMLAVLIATVAIAMAARRYMLRHIASVAVMRCLGATQPQITRLMTMEFLVVAMVGAALGCLLGYAAHLGLLALLGEFITTELPSSSMLPALQGLVTGVWLLLGFALPSLAQLRTVPPVQVLRGAGRLPGSRLVFGYLVGIAGFVLLLLWVAGNLALGLLTAGGFLLAFGLFAVLSWAGLACLAPLRRLQERQSVVWRFALAGLVRRRSATVAQICALSIGLMAMLLLAITRTDLIDGWRTAAPPDAPNRFLINVQPHQRDAVQSHLAEAGIRAELHPIVRGRLIAVNGQTLDADAFEDRRARRVIDRESNLSYSAQMPAHDRLVEGRWFEAGQREISLDAELAASLQLKLGDRLTYDVAGEQLEATLTSLRSPDWDSLAVNFFVVTSPEVLRDAPQTWMTSFHVPDTIKDPLPGLVAQYPNLSVFNVGAILQQVQSILDQVIVAVQGLFVFTLAAGVLVLYAALSATRDERIREAGLLRALGATRTQLERAQWLELSILGAMAGVLAALAASTLAWALARFIFQFDMTPGLWVWLVGIGAGVLAALAGGHAGLRGVLRTPPMVTLREA